MTGASVTKTVHIISNDPENPEYALHLTGAVLPILELDLPIKLITLRGLAGHELRTEFDMYEGSPLSVEILSTEVANGNAGIESITPVEGEKGRWHVVLTASPVARPLAYNDQVKVNVRTSDGVLRTVTFILKIEHNARVLTSPKGQVKFLPREVDRLRGPEAKPISRAIRVMPGGDEVEFRVTEVRLDENLEGIVRAEVRPDPSGKSFIVQVWIDEWQEKRQMIGRLTIVTDDPETSEIPIWVMAMFTPSATTGGGTR